MCIQSGCVHGAASVHIQSGCVHGAASVYSVHTDCDDVHFCVTGLRAELFNQSSFFLFSS